MAVGTGVEVETGAGLGVNVGVGIGPTVCDGGKTAVAKGGIGPIGVLVLKMAMVAVANGDSGDLVAVPTNAAGPRVGVDRGDTTVGEPLSAIGVIGREGLCMPQPIMITAITGARQKRIRLNQSLQTRKH
ncbi:MAG: hypothetical protein Q7O66_08490 [Dehalococcoidia bacterium]|nr:hypothetical protein [Dehalococcoidia bacterium]